MRFLEWITTEGLTFAEAAERTGAHDATDARRLAYGQIPRPDRMRRIYEATGGQVTPNDFYDLPELPECDPPHTPETAAPGRASTEHLDEIAAPGGPSTEFTYETAA